MPNRRGSRVPVRVSLRECSVVIIGSTCQICSRDFKCETDVALHKRWRHHGSLIGSLEDGLYAETSGEKCNVCDTHLETVSDLRIRKRQVHRSRKRATRRGTVRVRFKLYGVTMTDVTLDRKYLKMQSVLRYFVDVSTQTELLENERRQDNCATNIDLSFLPGYAANDALQCDIRQHKATNRYIVGKFASMGRPTVTVGRSLAEISNTPHRDTISDNVVNGLYVRKRNPSRDVMSREDRADAFILSSLVDDIDVQDKENSRTMNARERSNVYCQSETSILDDSRTTVSPARQQNKSNIVRPIVCKASYEASKSFKSSYTAAKLRSNENTAKCNLSTESTSPLINNVTDVDVNGNNNILDDVRVTMKHSSAPFRLNGKNESVNTNVENNEEVQEVLRIMRGNVKNDINHESPNRMEREILVQNAVNEMCVFSAHRQSDIYMEKYGKINSAALMANDAESSDYSSFASIAKSSYKLLADAFSEKLSICLKDRDHYGINYYDDLEMEINDNLEEYAMYAHEGFLVERGSLEQLAIRR